MQISTTVEMPSRPAHHSTRHGSGCGDLTSLAITADETNAATIGVEKAASRMQPDASGWPRQDLSCC